MQITDPEQAIIAADILKAVAHPLRLRIVALLCSAPRHVNALAEELQVSQPVVSQQLRTLRSLGLVGAVRHSGFATYAITEPHLHDLIGCLSNCVCSRGEGVR